jgi:hypothetical protein
VRSFAKRGDKSIRILEAPTAVAIFCFLKIHRTNQAIASCVLIRWGKLPDENSGAKLFDPSLFQISNGMDG